MSINTVPQAFVFMKVGSHAGETFEQILERKNREYNEAGMIFWGYGGSACHPISQVQPFAKGIIEKDGTVCLLMEPINSKADPDIVPATEYSEDGVVWKPVPKGITVTGSRYALVLDEIMPGALEVSTEEFVVGIGPSRGRLAADYLKGRIDKACLLRDMALRAKDVTKSKHIKYHAKLLEPYAVLLK